MGAVASSPQTQSTMAVSLKVSGDLQHSRAVKLIKPAPQNSHAFIFADFCRRYLEQEIFERESEIHCESSRVWIGVTFM